MVRRVLKSFSERVREDPPPDLLKLVTDHGGYEKVPEEAWEAFRKQRKAWEKRWRLRHYE